MEEAAEGAWIQHVVDTFVDGSSVMSVCTPSRINNEGDPGGLNPRNTSYGRGYGDFFAYREILEGWVEADPGWELCAPRPFSLVCFRKVGSDAENEEILRRVNDSGEIFLSHTKLAGRVVLRLAIGNARTAEENVAHAWSVLRREAARS